MTVVVRSHTHPPNTPRLCVNARRGWVCVRANAKEWKSLKTAIKDF